MVRENLFSWFATNKGADQPAQSDKPLLFTYWKISYLNLLQVQKKSIV